MKNLHSILHWGAPALCAALLLLSACQQEQDVLPEAGGTLPQAPVEVGFTLATTGGQPSTRVGTDESGTGYENYIDIAGDNFRFLLFNPDGDTYVYTFQPESVTPAGSTGTSQTYYVQGEMPAQYADFHYKVVVLANWPTYPDNLTEDVTTIEDICDDAASAYTYAEDFAPSATQLIPMYGVKEINRTLRPDLSTNLGTIDLLRAMCKIEVTCSATGFSLEDVTLSHHSTAGMCAPLNVYTDTETDWEGNNNTNEEVHMPATDNNISNVDVHWTTVTNEDGTTSYITYVPEYQNTVSAAHLELDLRNAEGDPVSLKGEPYIYFQDYDDANGTPVAGTTFDLVRNHWYRYDITAVDDGQLTFKYRVLRWNLVESAIGWDGVVHTRSNAPVAAWRLATAEGYDEDDVDNHVKGSLTVAPDFEDARNGDEEATFCYVLYPRYDGSAHQALEDAPSYAGFYFSLTEPKGAIWEAVLSNTEDFRLNENGPHDIDGDDVDDKKCAIRGIARPEPYQIQVTAVNKWTNTTFPKDEEGKMQDGADATDNEPWGDQIEADGTCKNIYTDLSIRISIDGGQTWNYLDINKEDRWDITYTNSDETTYKGYIEHTYWGERRFAGGDKYIRIWQLKAKYNKGFDELIKDLDDTWGIKRSWSPYNKPTN